MQKFLKILEALMIIAIIVALIIAGITACHPTTHYYQDGYELPTVHGANY